MPLEKLACGTSTTTNLIETVNGLVDLNQLTTEQIVSGDAPALSVGDIIDTVGEANAGDGWGAKWIKTSSTGTPSQNPLDYSSGDSLTDADGSVWVVLDDESLPYHGDVFEGPVGRSFISATITQGEALTLNYPNLGYASTAACNFISEVEGINGRLVYTVTELRGNGGTKGRKFVGVNDRGTWSGWEELNTVNISDEILKSKIVISDTMEFVSSSDCNMTYDPEKGMVYVVYLASREEYGESQDANVLTVFPLKQPWRAEHYIVSEVGETISGIEVTSSFGCNVVNLTDEVRVFSRINVDTYYYRDFNKVTKTWGGLVPVKLDIEGTVVDFTQSAFNGYLTDNGYAETSNVFMIGNIQFFNSNFYTMISGGPTGNPVVAKSSDSCRTWQLRGIIPELTAWESDMCILSDETMHIINRNKSDNNFFTSYDLGLTFNSGYLLPMQLQRPRLKSYKNRVLIVYSTTSQRTNFIIKYGTGEDPTLYEDKVEVSSDFFTVYPTIIDYKDEVYVCFSNGELYPEYNVGTATRGKDCLNFARIGDIDFNVNFTIDY